MDEVNSKVPSEKSQEVSKQKGNPGRPKKWICEEDDPLWRIYLKSYIEKEKQLEKADKFDRRRAAQLARLPDLEVAEEIFPPYQYLPLTSFNLRHQVQLPNRDEKVRIWRNMITNPEVDMRSSILPSTSSQKSDTEFTNDELNFLKSYFEKSKDVIYPRIPKLYLPPRNKVQVDRSCGNNNSLVTGDYFKCKLILKNSEECIYTGVCLRGTKGMHLIELSLNRERNKSWKFCFYQAITALLAKTQLRYKYVSSGNVDYIFDQGWLLFLHMGHININNKQHFDDVVIYNYKFNVELNLISEMKNINRITDVNWKYFEKNFHKNYQIKRPELMKTTEVLGWEKIKQNIDFSVHEKAKEIEKWFDKLPKNYHNCIFQTNKFALAFWKDGNFWYLYNPYRCNKYGLWDKSGFSCIIKFCTKITLRRHLMILLLRAYAYDNLKSNRSDRQVPSTFNIRIFNMIYHGAGIYDMESLKRQRSSGGRKVWKNLDESDPLVPADVYPPDEVRSAMNIEKSFWLNEYKISWSRVEKVDIGNEKMKWHEYYVEDNKGMYSLWGNIHPSHEIFPIENRGKQIYSCYVVCAGMIRLITPEYWSSKTLDTIVVCGDQYYRKNIKNKESISINTTISNYLDRYFNIGDVTFEIDLYLPINGKLYTGKSLWNAIDQLFRQHTFGILNCENVSLAIFKSSGCYYMLDCKTIGPPLFDYGKGVPYLIRATSFQKFMIVLMLTINSTECSPFQINPVKIIKVVEGQ